MVFQRGVVAVLLLASAIAVEQAEVVSLDDKAQSLLQQDPEHLNWNLPDGDIIYRISWTSAAEGEEMSVLGNINIDITGTNGESTGDLFVVTHPGMKCNGDDSPRCYTDKLGNVPTEKSKGSATCGCDPTNPDYNEDDAKWVTEPGLHQNVYIVAKDVGEIGEVKITSDAPEKWDMKNMKINTNSQMTGLGSGVFYVNGAKVDSNKPLEAKLSASTTAGADLGSLEVGEGCSKNADCKTSLCDLTGAYKCELKCLSADASQDAEAATNCPPNTKSKITRCDASVCEEEMDRKLKIAAF
jgi:hypothetical protein